MSRLVLPQIDLVTTRYSTAERFPDGTVRGAYEEVPTDLPPEVYDEMNRCVELGEKALRAGNPPVGVVLLDHRTGGRWEGITLDKSTGNLLGHGEILTYNEAQPTVGNNLRDCTLITTAELCNTCTTPYAEGKIGRIVCGVTRRSVWDVAGLMRPRAINMRDLLLDGDIDTEVTVGVMSERILANFAIWAELRDSGEVPA